MLYERGIGVEMTHFHQLASGAHTATFVQGSDGHAGMGDGLVGRPHSVGAARRHRLRQPPARRLTFEIDCAQTDISLFAKLLVSR